MANKMQPEESKVDQLSAILDRILDLSSTQDESNTGSTVKKAPLVKDSLGQSATPNMNISSKEESSSPNDKQAQKESKKSSQQKEVPPTVANATKDTVNISNKEESLSPEIKQTARKAQNESKKSNKKEEVQPAIPNALKDTETAKKSKADLKKERRQIQEAQRNAKALAKEQAATPKPTEAVTTKILKEPTKKVDKPRRKVIPLLDHLVKVDSPAKYNPETIHSAVYSASFALQERYVDGCNARVAHMLSALAQLIEDYETPKLCDLARDLSTLINHNVEYMKGRRQFIEPMISAVKYLKKIVNNIHSDTEEAEAKKEILANVDAYVAQNITLASKNIVSHLLKVTGNKEVIITFGFSPLFIDFVERAANHEGKRFSIIVVDASPNGRGWLMAKQLEAKNFDCSYHLLCDLCHIIKKVTLVVVEAQCVDINGSIIGHSGMALLLCVANSRTIPVLVMSQTYKFCNHARTDAFCHNEILDPSDIVTGNSSLQGWEENPYLNVIKLAYDVSPDSYVHGLVTETGIIRTSMIPVLLERNFGDILC